jgi:NADH-quinone oxidoreductase subunit N
MTDATTIKLLSPEIVLVAVATFIYLAGAFAKSSFRPLGVALLGLLGASVALLATRDLSREALTATEQAVVSGPIVVDLFGHTARWAILIVGALLVLLTDRPLGERQAAEYTASLLLIVAGLMIAVSANDLVLLFVGLELVSIPTYVVLYLGKRGAAAQEATIKYFFLSVLSSAVLLYGFSFLYGIAGATQIDAIAAAIREQSSSTGAMSPFASIALVLILAGLAFRLAAVPFHFYAPDVFHGTSNANAGILATAPKVAGLVVLIRLVAGAMPGMETLAWKVTLAMSLLTMTLGNIVALWQSNLRRLLAYSSIAHAGYMLIGVSVGLGQTSLVASGAPGDATAISGAGAALFYLAMYALATLGTFAALTYLGNRDKEVDDVEELAGLGQTHPLMAAAIAVFMFSLAGVPPLAGFWGKFALFTGTIELGAPVSGERSELQRWFLTLAIVAVINAAIAAAYYLRVVATMYFRTPETAAMPVPAHTATETSTSPAAALAATIALAAVIGLGILPGRGMHSADEAGKSATRTPSAAPAKTLESASLLRKSLSSRPAE